jgi:hypothetical protein
MTGRKRPGDTVALGDDLGYSLEPDVRWARVVGITHAATNPAYPTMRLILRQYTEHDGDFPTGTYRRGSLSVVPWTGKYRTLAERHADRAMSVRAHP